MFRTEAGIRVLLSKEGGVEMSTRWMKSWPVAFALASVARAQTTECASVARQGNGPSHWSALSTDGRYVAFVSDATNLVPGDTNAQSDVFVVDRQTGAIQRVDVGPGGVQANSGATNVSISADGQYVTFQSDSTNLVAGDTNTATDIFVRDRVAGTTERVSLANDGSPTNASCTMPAISSDGRYVTFLSSASNLVPGASGGPHIYLRDRQSGTTEVVDVALAGGPGNGQCTGRAAISADGRYVAFRSFDSDLVVGDTNGKWDIFVRDRTAGTTDRVSVTSTGVEANDHSLDPPSISADGRYVAFFSFASNLVANDTNGSQDVFIRDRQLDTTIRASVATDGTGGNSASQWPSISADGRFVSFSSYSSNLVTGDTNATDDMFVRDLKLGTTERVSVTSAGAQANGGISLPSTSGISGDGRYVAFQSDATNLGADDTNGVEDVFVRDRQSGTTRRVSLSDQTGNSYSTQASMSADGQHVSFDGPSTNLVTGDTNGFFDVFLYDRTTTMVERVSVATGGAQANGPSFVSSTSSDGRYVAFESEATNLVASDANGNDKDVFVRDRQSGTTSIVSVSSGGVQGDDQSRAPVITPDGRYVAFWSFATTLVAGDTNGHGDIFVRDLQNGTTDIASVGTGGVQENGNALYPAAISADGRYVAFLSLATNLVAGDTNGATDVFVHDRQTGTTERVSVDSSGVQGNSDCYAPLAISADGRYVAFASDATNLVTGDTNNATDVFLRDRQNGTTVRVSLGTGGVQANMGGYSPSISADGRYVAFASDSTNLVAGDTNGSTDVFVRDCLFGTTERASLAGDGSQGNGGSSAPSISADGRVEAFESGASNLVPDDVNGTGDVFLRDRGTASAFASFCAGDGTVAACPCGNSGAAGHGCENSSTTGGALLTASGVASLAADTVSLTSSGEKPTATSVLLQGTSVVSPIHYGDGLRCVGGTLKRLYSHNAVGGVVTMPQGADVSISAASAAKGDVISVGSTRGYQIYYRDPSATYCPTPNGSTFNISSAILVAWGS